MACCICCGVGPGARIGGECGDNELRALARGHDAAFGRSGQVKASCIDTWARSAEQPIR